jgi:hypothetical protein
MRANTPLKSCFSTTIQPILPGLLSPTILEKRQSKKRVRFALKLDAIEEDSLSPDPNPENRVLSPTKPNKRIIDPWREGGPLYGAYVEYLEKQDTLTPDICDTNRPSRPLPLPESELESPVYTHTFVIQNKSPEVLLDAITITAPPLHLPRIVQQTPINKRISTNNKKQSVPIISPYTIQRTKVVTPPRQIQSRKLPSPVNHKNNLTPIHPTVKRGDITLPSIKELNSNEKSIRTDSSLGIKSNNEYLQTKKLTEIITNSVPGTNNQINHLPERPVLPNISKTPQISCDEPFFFQNHNNDHLQPIIHSTH